MPAEFILEPLVYGIADCSSTASGNAAWLVNADTSSAETKLGVGLDALITHLLPAAVAASADAVSAADHIDITLILPAETTLITAVSVPSAKVQHIRAAVPNLVEEWTASELEDLHIALGTRSASGAVPVVAVERAYLQQWVDTLASANLRADRVFVDALLLPYSPNTLTIVLNEKRALLRWSEQQGGAMEIDALEPFLRALLQHENIQTLQTFTDSNPSPNHEAFLRDALPAIQRLFTIDIERHPIGHSLLSFFSSQLAAAKNTALLNLRQGEFAPADDSYHKWRRWRPAAVVAGIGLALQIVLSIIFGLVFNHQAESVHAQSESLYRELFPQDKRLVNIQQQMQSHLNASSLSGHASFEVLFGHLAKEIQSTVSEHPPQLRALQYDANTGALQVEIIVDNVQVLDGLKSRLGVDRVTTKVLSAANENGALVGRISLSGG